MKNIKLLLLAIPTLLAGCAIQDAASIGIIGAADGPTDIYSVSNFMWFAITLGIIIAALAISAIIYLFKKKK